MGSKKKKNSRNTHAAKEAATELSKEKEQIAREQNPKEFEEKWKGGKQPKDMDRYTKQQLRKQRNRVLHGVGFHFPGSFSSISRIMTGSQTFENSKISWPFTASSSRTLPEMVTAYSGI